jgi:DNA-directed RNA polymerase specialized sigma subunit
MLTLESLHEYRSMKKEIEDLDRRITDIYQNSLLPRSSQITGMPRSPGYSNDAMDRIFEKIEELITEYIEKKARLIDRCLEIEKEIDSLKSIERRLLRYRYIDNLPWVEIGKIMDYSIVQLHRIHKKIFVEM